MAKNMITSLQHPLVKHFVKLRESRSYREEQGTVLVEGKKLVEELCEEMKPIHLISHETFSEAVFRKISLLEHPEGIMAEFPMPPKQDLSKKSWVMVLEGISDPGNLGTLLRTALALGWEGAFLLPGCCDPYNDKALRAAMGATFRLPLATGSFDELLAMNPPLLVADIEGEKLSRHQGWLLLANEARGPSPLAKSFPKVTIPMPGAMESLNVASAGAILLYALKHD